MLGSPLLVASAVARVEVARAVKRAGDAPMLRRQARKVLARLHLFSVTDEVLDHAARLEPPALRALDAIHLATALSIDELTAFVTYDDRQAAAAAAAGLEVQAPGG